MKDNFQVPLFKDVLDQVKQITQDYDLIEDRINLTKRELVERIEQDYTNASEQLTDLRRDSLRIKKTIEK